jgi:hypothetical protein
MKRRDFIKATGLLAAGATVAGSGILSGCTSSNGGFNVNRLGSGKMKLSYEPYELLLRHTFTVSSYSRKTRNLIGTVVIFLLSLEPMGPCPLTTFLDPAPETPHKPAPAKEEHNMHPSGHLCRIDILFHQGLITGNIGVIIRACSEIIALNYPELTGSYHYGANDYGHGYNSRDRR